MLSMQEINHIDFFSNASFFAYFPINELLSSCHCSFICFYFIIFIARVCSCIPEVLRFSSSPHKCWVQPVFRLASYKVSCSGWVSFSGPAIKCHLLLIKRHGPWCRDLSRRQAPPSDPIAGLEIPTRRDFPTSGSRARVLGQSKPGLWQESAELLP